MYDTLRQNFYRAKIMPYKQRIKVSKIFARDTAKEEAEWQRDTYSSHGVARRDRARASVLIIFIFNDAEFKPHNFGVLDRGNDISILTGQSSFGTVS